MTILKLTFLLQQNYVTKVSILLSLTVNNVHAFFGGKNILEYDNYHIVYMVIVILQ